MERLRSELEGFLGKKKTIRTAGVAMVAVIGVATALWLKPAKELPATIGPSTTQQVSPDLSTPQAVSVTGAPVATTAGTLVHPGQLSPSETAVETKDSQLSKAASKSAVAPAPAAATRPLHKATAANGQPPKKPDDQKYDSLKKAWGG